MKATLAKTRPVPAQPKPKLGIKVVSMGDKWIGTLTVAGLKFDVGEHVWIAGPWSYLTGPIPVGAVPNWGDLWFVSNQVKIVGIRLIDDKLYYVFPGGGDDSGSRMFRSKDEAELCVSNHNSKSTPN